MLQGIKKGNGMKKLIFTLFLCMVIPSAVLAAPVKKAIGIVYFAKSGEVVNVEENCAPSAVLLLRERFAKYGIKVDPVEMPLNLFLKRAAALKIPESNLQAEWNRFVSSNYDAAFNVYIDRYKKNPHRTADAAVRMIVTPPSDFKTILVKGEGNRKNVQNTAPIDAMKNALSDIVNKCGKKINALK